MTDRARILAIYRAQLAAFRRHTPFGILLKEDLCALLRSTARDTGLTLTELRHELRGAALPANAFAAAGLLPAPKKGPTA